MDIHRNTNTNPIFIVTLKTAFRCVGIDVMNENSLTHVAKVKEMDLFQPFDI